MAEWIEVARVANEYNDSAAFVVAALADRGARLVIFERCGWMGSVHCFQAALLVGVPVTSGALYVAAKIGRLDLLECLWPAIPRDPPHPAEIAILDLGSGAMEINAKCLEFMLSSLSGDVLARITANSADYVSAAIGNITAISIYRKFGIA